MAKYSVILPVRNGGKYVQNVYKVFFTRLCLTLICLFWIIAVLMEH
jgi:hypothetical protein